MFALFTDHNKVQSSYLTYMRAVELIIIIQYFLQHSVNIIFVMSSFFVFLFSGNRENKSKRYGFVLEESSLVQVLEIMYTLSPREVVLLASQWTFQHFSQAGNTLFVSKVCCCIHKGLSCILSAVTLVCSYISSGANLASVLTLPGLFVVLGVHTLLVRLFESVS